MLRKKLNEIFAQDFDLEESKWRGPFDFVPRGSKNLFITIGDSWTYGWRLDDETSENKEEYRINHTYGNIISNTLNWDYLNISIPASNNLWMIEKFLQLVNYSGSFGYDKIKVFITLTEYGREFYTDFDGDQKLQERYKSCLTSTDVATAISSYISELLLTTSGVDFNLGINYVSNLYPKSLQPYILPLSWLEVLCGKTISEPCTVVGSWVIPKFENIINSNQNVDKLTLIDDLQNLVTQSNKRLDVIYNTGYNHKVGYGHPNSAGHDMWAKYIMNMIQF